MAGTRGAWTGSPALLGTVVCLLIGMCVGDVLLTMGNRDWASSSKIRRDFATWTSWDTVEDGFGSGIQQQILYAVDSPRYPPGSSQVDEHGVRTYWLTDAFSSTQQVGELGSTRPPVSFVGQLWYGHGLNEYDEPITVLKVLYLQVADLNGITVAEGMLNEDGSVLEYVIDGTFEPTIFFNRDSQYDFIVSNSAGLTYQLRFSVDYVTIVPGDAVLEFDLSADNPNVAAVLSMVPVSTFLVSLTADSDGHPSILFGDQTASIQDMEDLLAPSVGGSCLVHYGQTMYVLLWNTTSDAYEVYFFDLGEDYLYQTDTTDFTLNFFARTGLTDRNCGATVSTTAPVMVTGGLHSLLIFCGGVITVVDTNSTSTRVVPGYIHGVVAALLLTTYDQEGSYKFSEATSYAGTDSSVSWEELRTTASQLFWLTSTNTANQVNCLMESDMTTGDLRLNTANVLQWMPDTVSADIESSILAMSVHCSASNGDFLFYSATIETATGHEEAIVVVDVRTVQSSREFSIFSPSNGMSILQLVYDVEDNCLYGLQEVYSTTDSETRVVEIFSSLVKIPLSSDAAITAGNVLDMSGWSVVSSEVVIRTVSPHNSLEQVPFAYDPYHHSWMFIDGLYGEVVILDPRDGSMWALDVDWSAADLNSRFALSLSYDSQDGVLFVLAPLVSSPVFMEVAAVPIATSTAAIFYSDQHANEFSFALDCESCFVSVHAGSHSLILRSQFAAVVYPLDEVTHSEGSNPTEFALTVLDSGEWQFLLSSPLVTSPAPLSPYALAIRFEDFHVSPLDSSSTADVVLLTSTSFVAPLSSTSSPEGSGSWLFVSVAAACAFVIIVVIVVLVIIAKRTSALGQPSILAHATPVFDDEIGDKDL